LICNYVTSNWVFILEEGLCMMLQKFNTDHGAILL
jgi:hypothetical protein